MALYAGVPLTRRTTRRVCTASGKRKEMIILLALAAVVVAAPIAAALLVSLASLREDARQSLNGKAPSWVARAARSLLSVPSRGAGRRGGPEFQSAPPRSAPPRSAQPQVPHARVPEDEDLSSWLTGPQA